jgi:hypothetical protein
MSAIVLFFLLSLHFNFYTMSILVIYLIVGFFLILIPIFVKASFKLVLMILFFPAAPFLLAWNIRNERPVVAKLIFILWGLLYSIFILLAILT